MLSLFRLSALMAASALTFALGVPGLSAAGDEERIRELIQASQYVPADYRQQVNIVVDDANSRALISVYKDPNADQNDCKIDGILMARQVLQAVPGLKNLSFFFYDLAAGDKIIQVDISAASVIAYGQGSLNKAGVLQAARLTVKQSNNLADRFAGRSYKEIVERLGVIEGPSRDQRALALVRINQLTSCGRDTVDLKKRYLHIEDLTRRRDLAAMRRELKELNAELVQTSSVDREAALESLSSKEVN